MTLLDNPNPDPRGKWGWWGNPNISDEDIVDYEMWQRKVNLPIEWGGFGGMGPRLDGRYGYIPGFDNNVEPDIHLLPIRYPRTPRLPGQTGFDLGDGFVMETDPFGGGIMGKLAGRYGLLGGLGGLIGAGIGALTKRG